MRALLLSGALFAGLGLVNGHALAAVQIDVNLTTQTMHVFADGRSYTWPVSTAAAGYQTPTGVFHPTWLSANHVSHEYDSAPMPYSIFFHDGDAIHGTNLTSLLGRPASHGCVHLSVQHAALLYKLVQKQGATIDITGQPPASGSPPPLEQAVGAPLDIRAERRQPAYPDYASPPDQAEAPGPSYFVQQPPRVYYVPYRSADPIWGGGGSSW